MALPAMGNAHLYELAAWWAWEQELTHSQRLVLGGTGEMVPPLTTEVRGGGSLHGPRLGGLWTHHDHSPINHPRGMASARRGPGRKVRASSPEFPQKPALSRDSRVAEEETPPAERGREREREGSQQPDLTLRGKHPHSPLLSLQLRAAPGDVTPSHFPAGSGLHSGA